jgi:Domain of unknown function (DUF6316)
MNRKNETDKVWFRGNRCFSADGGWFISTREGVDIGPFESRQTALMTVPRYVNSVTKSTVAESKMKSFKGIALETRKVAQNGIWASNNYL